jgi:Glycosyl transferases group 1
MAPTGWRGESGPRTMIDVLIVSLGSTGGLRAADEELRDSLQRAGASVELVRPAPPAEVRTLTLTDLSWARAARAATVARLARARVRAVIYSSTTAALLWPRPGAIRFDAPAAGNRLGRHGLWQRPLERRRLRQASLLLPWSEGALAELPDMPGAGTEEEVDPVRTVGEGVGPVRTVGEGLDLGGPAGEGVGPVRTVGEGLDLGGPVALKRSIGLPRFADGARALVVPMPVEPSASSLDCADRDIAAITYGANPAKKGLDRVLEAWDRARRPDEELVVAGVERRDLTRAGVVLPEQGVRVVGMLAPADYRAMLRRARVFVCAPRREDYGVAQLEALADGCQLVSTPAPGPYVALPIARALDSRLVGDNLSEALRSALDAPVADYSMRALLALGPFRRDAVDRTVARDLLPRLLAR